MMTDDSPAASRAGASCDVVIPLYRELESLPALVAALEATSAELPAGKFLLVDDGSDDGTAQLAESLLRKSCLAATARVLRHSKNLGLSAALRTGFQASQAEIVCWLDADLSYPTSVLPDLLQLLAAGADVATVSPWHPGGHVEGVALPRVWLSKGLSRACRVIGGGQRVYTWSAMVRAWKRETLARCLPEREGHLGVTESLLRARAIGARIAELPTTLHGRVAGRSALRILPGIAGQVGLLGAAATGRLKAQGRAEAPSALSARENQAPNEFVQDSVQEKGNE